MFRSCHHIYPVKSLSQKYIKPEFSKDFMVFTGNKFYFSFLFKIFYLTLPCANH